MPTLEPEKTTTCEYKSVVKRFRKILKTSGLKKGHLPPECPKEVPENCPCPAFYDHCHLIYNQAAGDASGDLLDLVDDLFGDTNAVDPSFHPTMVKSKKFWCPELKIFMHQACDTRSCKFHSVGNGWTGNCILHYMTKNETASLSYNELTFLLNIPTPDLRSDLLASLRKMRNGALKEIIVKEDQTGLFERLPSKKVCAVCEGPVETPIVKRGFCYCSEYCLSKRPPKVLKIEHEFCISFNQLISICEDRFNHNHSYIATALGVSKSALLDMCNQCGIVISEEQM